jgi:hypothetical protein
LVVVEDKATCCKLDVLQAAGTNYLQRYLVTALQGKGVAASSTTDERLWVLAATPGS